MDVILYEHVKVWRKSYITLDKVEDYNTGNYECIYSEYDYNTEEILPEKGSIEIFDEHQEKIIYSK